MDPELRAALFEVYGSSLNESARGKLKTYRSKGVQKLPAWLITRYEGDRALAEDRVRSLLSSSHPSKNWKSTSRKNVGVSRKTLQNAKTANFFMNHRFKSAIEKAFPTRNSAVNEWVKGATGSRVNFPNKLKTLLVESGFERSKIEDKFKAALSSGGEDPRHEPLKVGRKLELERRVAGTRKSKAENKKDKAELKRVRAELKRKHEIRSEVKRSEFKDKRHPTYGGKGLTLKDLSSDYYNDNVSFWANRQYRLRHPTLAQKGLRPSVSESESTRSSQSSEFFPIRESKNLEPVMFDGRQIENFARKRPRFGSSFQNGEISNGASSAAFSAPGDVNSAAFSTSESSTSSTSEVASGEGVLSQKKRRQRVRKVDKRRRKRRKKANKAVERSLQDPKFAKETKRRGAGYVQLSAKEKKEKEITLRRAQRMYERAGFPALGGFGMLGVDIPHTVRQWANLSENSKYVSSSSSEEF